MSQLPSNQNEQVGTPGTESVKDMESRRSTRRALLAAISGAGVAGAMRLPSQWSRPVVDHVLLPAHAAGSVTGCTLICQEAASYAITIFTSADDSITTFTLHLTEGVICARQPNGDSSADSNTSSEVYNTSTASDGSFFTNFTATSGVIIPTGSSTSTTLSPTDCQIPATQFFQTVFGGFGP